MADEDDRYTLFEQVCWDDCASWECQYLDITTDPAMTGDSPDHYECTGNSEDCPVVEHKIDTMRDMEKDNYE